MIGIAMAPTEVTTARAIEIEADDTPKLVRVFRLVRRSVILAGIFTYGALDYLATAAAGKMGNPRLRRAVWLRRTSRAVAWGVGLRGPWTHRTPIPGLLVCNHLSYLDILALTALGPCVFVAKREVAEWPVVGTFARMGGTIFIDREKRSDVVRVNAEIQAALTAGVTVVLFPEGTSSAGREVLPLRPSTLESVVALQVPVTPAAISYSLWMGDVAEEVCYWRDMSFAPHLLNLLQKRHVRARVAVGRASLPGDCRKTLAARLHREISDLLAGLQGL